MRAVENAQDPYFMNVESLGELEEVTCALCNSSHSRIIAIQHWFGEEFHVVRCEDCGLLYTNPRPTPGWRRRFYDPRCNPLIREKGRDFLYLPAAERVAAYERLLAFMRRTLGATGRLLDGGCAAGQFVKMAIDEGFDAQGFDCSPGASAYAKITFGLDIIQADAEELPIPDCSYDVVTLLHTFEHVSNPLRVLREMKRVLRPGGLLVIEAPSSLQVYLLERHFSCLRGLFLRSHPCQSEQWKGVIPWFPFDHYYHWTPKTLLAAMRKAGLEHCRQYVIPDYSSFMAVDGHFSSAHRLYMAVVRFLFEAGRERLNLWGVLIATGKKP